MVPIGHRNKRGCLLTSPVSPDFNVLWSKNYHENVSLSKVKQTIH